MTLPEAAVVLGLSERGLRYIVHTRRLLSRYKRRGRLLLDAREGLVLREARLTRKKTGRPSILDARRRQLSGVEQAR